MGGRGGWVNNGGVTWSGGGGGGGSAGAFRLRTMTAVVDGMPVASGRDFKQRIRNLIRQTGGSGGEPGLGGDPRETGNNGSGCTSTVEVSAR